jgi:hypothetical protein
VSGTADTVDVRAPCRVSHSYTQSLIATPADVFPLLCPVRECEWVPGWRPAWVISNTGVAEPGCIFQTGGEGDSAPATWVITRHDPVQHRAEMVKLIPDHTLTRLEISLEPDAARCTRATISYEFTALSAEGEAFVKTRTAEWYEGFMRDWESVLNAYLRQLGEDRA